MPMLLSTPERWFRTRQCDFYEFRPAHDPGDRPVALPAELTDWLAVNFPDRELQPLGPSEHSGWISGGPSMKVLALNSEEVQRYSQRWEDADGTSLDPRWQCYQWSYQKWRDRCARIQVTAGMPPAGTPCRWLLCSTGLYWLRGRYTDESQHPNFPGEASFDDWWVVCQSFPEVLEATNATFMMGSDYVAADGKRTVIFETYRREDGDVTYASLFGVDGKAHFTEQVRCAMALPNDVEIECGYF